MADSASLLQISESINHMTFLKDLPDTEKDERVQIEAYLADLISRQENKLDNIIGLIKKCDAYVDALTDELNEIKGNLDAWKKNKDRLTKLIKFAYQQNMIPNKITGTRYQATIKSTKSRLVDNFDSWSEEEVLEFGLVKRTTISRLKDDSVVEVKEETLPDKDRLRTAIETDAEVVPVAAELVPGYSLVYERRKRLTT